MPVVLGDQIGLGHVRSDVGFFSAAGGLAVVGKVVVGIHVLQKSALLQIAHAAGLPVRVQLVGNGVGYRVQLVVVCGLVDPHAPQDHGWVVAVLHDHLMHVGLCLLLPGFIPQMLPAGDLGEHQQPQLVAPVHKMLGLGIMGGAHGVQPQLPAQDIGVQPLHGCRHSVAHIGVGLVAVQAPELELSPVQIVAVRAKLRAPEAEPDRPAVQNQVTGVQGQGQVIQVRGRDVPQSGVRHRDRRLASGPQRRRPGSHGFLGAMDRDLIGQLRGRLPFRRIRTVQSEPDLQIPRKAPGLQIP